MSRAHGWSKDFNDAASPVPDETAKSHFLDGGKDGRLGGDDFVQTRPTIPSYNDTWRWLKLLIDPANDGDLANLSCPFRLANAKLYSKGNDVLYRDCYASYKDLPSLLLVDASPT